MDGELNGNQSSGIGAADMNSMLQFRHLLSHSIIGLTPSTKSKHTNLDAGLVKDIPRINCPAAIASAIRFNSLGIFIRHWDESLQNRLVISMIFPMTELNISPSPRTALVAISLSHRTTMMRLCGDCSLSINLANA
jgi:hypothetical protein